MPNVTDRILAADALHQAFLVNLIAEAELQVNQDGSDSGGSSGSSDTSDSSSDTSSSEDEALPPMSEVFLDAMGGLYSKRYLNARQNIIKDKTQLYLLLSEYKANRPEIFRSYLRIDPSCFDDLVEVIKDDDVFQNNSNNPQMPVDEQLAIALYRFGHYGNAASTMKVALWAGVGFGTVPLVTNRVLKVLCSERFCHFALRWSSNAAKEAAKEWVEQQSCPAWRNGWLMVDGTLVPLFLRPGFYGNTWFDRKSNYSMNVQIISTPDLRIIDYGVGLPGSQHDSTAWVETRIPQEHERLLGQNEWVWGDSAYPLKNWCQAPYKKPEKDTRDNTTYNYHVSAVRIRSEHCMGFLKGRWSSLRGLRAKINNEKGLQLASLWITACIHLHAFAMDHEDAQFITKDRFYREGRKIMIKERRELAEWNAARENDALQSEHEREEQREIELLEGKLKRERLKKDLFVYLDSE